MKRYISFIPALLCLFFGCASPGPKYLDLQYTPTLPAAAGNGSIGLARFTDRRPAAPKGQVGYRALPGGDRETFVVSGMDAAAALTRITRSHLEHNGFRVSLIPEWPRTAKAVAALPHEHDHVLSGDINHLECRAQKMGVTTDMTLSIDLTLYWGTPETRRLKTIPIALNLERTELTFSRKKVEIFMNQALEEVLAKALPFQ